MENEAISICWEENEDKYRLRMVRDGLVDGVLKASTIIKDNRKMICYNTDGFVSLDRWCRAREIKDEELTWILKSILNTLVRAEKFLLSPGAFPLDPASIFINDLMGKVCLVIRKEDGDWQAELIRTAKLILEAIDYNDTSCVKQAYEFLHLCLKEGLRIDELLSRLEERDFKIIVDEKLDLGEGDIGYSEYDEGSYVYRAGSDSWIDIQREQSVLEKPKRDKKKLIKKIAMGVCTLIVCVLLMKTALT